VSGRRLAWLGAAGLLAAAVVLAPRLWRDEFDLPARIRVEEVVQELSAGFDPASVVEQARDAPVHAGWIRPSQNFHAEGGLRRALVAPPPSTMRFRVRLPPGAVLRFGAGVEGDGKKDPDAAGIRFRVAVDGRERYARDIDPAGRRSDRRWLDERVDLGVSADREVEITLRTERAEAGARLAGMPGWSDVRVVEESWRERQVASPAAPNVVVLLVDTLRADRLGAYGASPSPSPTLDRLAARGVVFEQMVAQSSWTMPTVATVMTGLYPRDHGLEDWQAGALSNLVPTLAESAARAGISTVGVSANPLVSRRTSFARGFEYFVDYARDQTTRDWAHGPEVNRPFFAWLERNHGHRFLAYLQYMEPHDPYMPPPELRPPPPPGIRAAIAKGFLKRFTPKIGVAHTPTLQPAEIQYLRALYDAEIRSWDTALGRVLAELERVGLAGSTVVVVTADHGEEFQEHGRLTHGSHLYEETIRVPLVVVGPGIAPGRVRESAQGIDVFPTVAGLLAIAPPRGLPGVDLLRVRQERPVYSETHMGIAANGSALHLVSVRQDGWKLIHTPALGRFELYDLTRDPAEREDRFGAPEGADLQRLLAAWESSAPQAREQPEPDPALHERLKALGYVQ
jgi:arylsulfatase A-like enzyme